MIRLVWIIPLLVIVLIGCKNQGQAIGKIQEVQDGEIITTLVDDTKTASMKQDIDSLVMENSVNLSISQPDSTFVTASDSFTLRMINLLSLHGEAVAKVVDVGLYDLVLRFDGYKDIHVNLKSSTFWFEGADHLYSIQEQVDLSTQWERYMIRLVDGEPMYDAFEKTILSKGMFTDSSQNNNEVTLFYDGDIRLRVNEAETVIRSNLDEQSLSYNVSQIPQNVYTLQFLGEQPLIAVVHHFATAKGSNLNLDVFTYRNQDMQNVFSSIEDMSCTINQIEIDKGVVTIGFPYADSLFTYPLTQTERERSENAISELEENGINMNEKFMESIAENLICQPIEITFADVNKDGNEDVLLLTTIHSVGAKTPVRINTNVVFVFKLNNDMLLFDRVELENSQESKDNPVILDIFQT